MDRHLAAITSIDVVGYSRLMEADETDTLDRLKDLRTSLIDPLIGAQSGRIVKLMGDGALLEFASVVQAVTFAVQMQRRMADYNQETPTEQRIDYRVGINLGDVLYEDSDIFGDGVNVAARLEGLAEPGGICISGTVYDHVKSRLDCGLEYLGEHQVKNIREPVRVYKVNLDADNALRGAAASGGASVRPKSASVALRRFVVHSGDAALKDLTEAFCEDLEIAFAQLQTFRVLANTLSGPLTAESLDVAELQRRLDVEYLLQGSVRPRGSRLRINAQIIHLGSGFNVWAERYDCSGEEFEAGADAIIEALVASAQTQIVFHQGASEKQVFGEHERVEHLASKAWSMLYRLVPEAADQAEKLCVAALSLDPRAARAHQALSSVLHHQYYMGWTDAPGRVLKQGLEHIDRAIEINDADEYSHWTRGNVLMDLRSTQKALAAFDRSRELNPTFSLAVASRGTVCAWAGMAEEAIQCSEHALAANPKDPSNFFRFNTIAVAHFTLRDYARSLEWAEKTVNRRSKFLIPHLIGVASAAYLDAPDLPAKVSDLLEEFPQAAKIALEMTPFTRSQDIDALRIGLEKALAPGPGN